MVDSHKLLSRAMMEAEKYTEKDLEHVKRVSAYVTSNPFIPFDKKDFCMALAIMHDYLEEVSTEIPDGFPEYFLSCLQLLTHKKNETYMDYIRNISRKRTEYPEAYWVKMADMKDHLSMRDTLSDKLKDKYTEALAELL